MGVVPSQDQVMGQLRIIIPALGTIVSAVGVSSGDVSKWENIAMISVGPISYIVVGIWSLVANSRESIMKAAAKPVDASTPAPQIILPPQEKALADKLPDNVTTAAPRAVAAVAKVLLIAFVLSAFLAIPSAQARGKKPAMTGNPIADIKTDLGLNQGPVKLTGNVDKDAQAIWDKIVAASQADLAYASKMAAVAGTPASGIRKQCYDAIYDLNVQVNGQNVKDATGAVIPKPDPKLFTDVESLAETIDNLSPQGKLFTSCAGMAQMTKTNTLTLINSIVTGAAGLAAMPVIPGL